MPSSHLILCRPLLLLLPILPSIRVFSNESALRMRWPKYWSFSFNISPSNEYPGLISFRMDWLDLLAVQGTLKSLLQHHRSKASILQCSAFFIVQLSHPYMTTEKNIALTRWTFVSKVMSLLFNMLSRLVIAFLPRSKHLLISWLQLPSAVILEPPKIKSDTVSTVSPSIILYQDLINHFLRQVGSPGGHLGPRAKEKQHSCSLHPPSTPTGPLDGWPHSLPQLGFLFHGDLGAQGLCFLPATHISENQAWLRGSDIESSPDLPLRSREPETQPASCLCMRAKSPQSCPILCDSTL